MRAWTLFVILLGVLFLCTPCRAADVTKSLTVVFGHEGGLQCESADPGNWTGGKVGLGRHGCTKYGIATNTYPREDIKNLTLARAGMLYKRDFWNPLHLTEFKSQGLATETFDTAVNMGLGTSANFHLRLINILGPAHYKLNGRLNSEQVEWINKLTKKKVNRVAYWKMLNVLQGERYILIMEKNPNMTRYSNSWYSRVGD